MQKIQSDSSCSAPALVDHVRSWLKKNSAEVYYLAFSGGMDSTVLLHLMAQFQEQFNFRLVALHANHGLHQKASSWQLHCQNVCQQWNIEFHSDQLQLDNNSEAEARKKRYQWLLQQVPAAAYLLTAHHQRDRVETLLFNLMRGAGSKGLSSLRERRLFSGVELVRPLLKCSHQHLQSYAEVNKLPYIVDSSNDDTAYSRNFIRHEILPKFRQFRRDAYDGIARSADNLQRENDLMREVAICDLVEVRELPLNPVDQSIAICFNDFRHLSVARRTNLLRFWFQSLRMHTPSRRMMDYLLEAMSTEIPPTTILQEEGCQYRFYRGYLYVLPDIDCNSNAITIDWNDLSQPVDLYDKKVRLAATDKLRYLVRERRPERVQLTNGDNLVNPKAVQGSLINMKKWMQQNAIPPWRRKAIPLLALSQSDGHTVVAAVDQNQDNDWLHNLSA